MTRPDEHADDRAAYSHRALARLVVSDAAAALADRAAAAVVPRSDDGAEAAAELVAAADDAVTLAEELRSAAVVHARARNVTWPEIGDRLGVAKQTAHTTYSGAVTVWESALREPYATGTDGHRYPRLPEAAMRPTATARRLDAWAADATGTDTAVSAALPALSTMEELSRVLDDLRRAHRTGADRAEAARLQARKAALLERIAETSGDADARATAAEARAYADALNAGE